MMMMMILSYLELFGAPNGILKWGRMHGVPNGPKIVQDIPKNGKYLVTSLYSYGL